VVVRVGSHGEAKLSVSITRYLIYWYSERCAEWPLCINQEVHEFNSFLSLPRISLTAGPFLTRRTGGFQHSSFLFGARVTSAGLLKVSSSSSSTRLSLANWADVPNLFFLRSQASDGKLTSLSPLSGHYRAGTMHFKAFLRGLEDQGVDMSSWAFYRPIFSPSFAQFRRAFQSWVLMNSLLFVPSPLHQCFYL
jgi:hypothetical protein